MRIWVINPYDDIPGEGTRQRYWTLCETLARRGHEVTWWSSVWSHRSKSRRVVDDSATVALQNVRLRLVEAPAYHGNVSLARLKNHRTFARNLQSDGEALLKANAPDLIVFSWPPMEVGRVALHWQADCRCRVVMDVMDAWPDNFHMLAPNTRGVDAIVAALLYHWNKHARDTCQRVDAVSTQSNAFAKWAIRKGYAGDPHVCYLGSSASLSRHSQDQDNESSLSESAMPLKLLYLGAMGRAYDLETLIAAVEILERWGVYVQLDLAGEGEKQPALREQVDQLGLSDIITFHGYVQGSDLTRLLEGADVGIIPMRPESLVAVPYKVGDYLGAGLPVISSLTGELRAMLIDAQCGESYQVGDPADLANAIRIYANDRQYLQDAGSRAKDLFEMNFNRNVTYERWADWLETVCA